jgi:hypothetical protein
VFELRQFDLQLALGASRPQGKDIENEAGSIPALSGNVCNTRCIGWNVKSKLLLS